MADTQRVAVLIGSLRKEAYSRKLARALTRLAPDSLVLEEVGFRDLPLYDQDMEEGGLLPPEWVRFRQQLRRADAVLFVTPEYNRSLPGGLKNAIDVGSRPYGQSAWEGKPGAVASVSPGAIGAFGANHHLRQMCVFLDIPLMPQPEAYIGGAADLFNAHGELVNDGTLRFLEGFMAAFARWVATNARAAATA